MQISVLFHLLPYQWSNILYHTILPWYEISILCPGCDTIITTTGRTMSNNKLYFIRYNTRVFTHYLSNRNLIWYYRYRLSLSIKDSISQKSYQFLVSMHSLSWVNQQITWRVFQFGNHHLPIHSDSVAFVIHYLDLHICALVMIKMMDRKPWHY